MTLTRHWHRIPGTPICEDNKPVGLRRVISCGGPGKCIQCTTDELDAFKKGPSFT